MGVEIKMIRANDTFFPLPPSLERVNVLSIIHTPSRADMYHTTKTF